MSSDSSNPTKPEAHTSRIILAMLFVMLAVFFERLVDFEQVLDSDNRWLFAGTLVVGFAIISLFNPHLIRWAPWLLIIGLLPMLAQKWTMHANHGWLTIWILLAAPLTRCWWADKDYWAYIRLTMGIVMLAACIQKLMAGTYLDGSYITYLSYHGGTTEQLFSFLCDRQQALEQGCTPHQAIGIFLVLWQAIVGLLLLSGLQSPVILFVEVAFLIGAGIYADELNFQVLNIAFLCMAFGVGMARWLAIVCSIMLIVDFFSLTRIVEHVLGL
ncbi:MAG: hypothetical protein ACPGSM_18985 [Thiolinea sp.]